MQKENIDTPDRSDILLENQKRILAKIEDIEKNLKRHQFVAYMRFILIAVPVLLGILLLIPAFHDIVTSYKDVLESLREAGLLKNLAP